MAHLAVRSVSCDDSDGTTPNYCRAVAVWLVSRHHLLYSPYYWKTWRGMHACTPNIWKNQANTHSFNSARQQVLLYVRRDLLGVAIFEIVVVDDSCPIIACVSNDFSTFHDLIRFDGTEIFIRLRAKSKWYLLHHWVRHNPSDHGHFDYGRVQHHPLHFLQFLHFWSDGRGLFRRLPLVI